MKKLSVMICLLVSFFVVSGCGNDEKAQVDTAVPGDFLATTFYIEGNEWMKYDNALSFDVRQRYQLGDSYSDAIKDTDLGEQMGTVVGCGNVALNGCAVYHYAKYPDIDTICIVDTPDGYRFFKCEWLTLPEDVLQSSDAAFSAYGLPDSARVIDVYSVSSELLFSIENEDVIREIFEILSGKVNIGMQEHNRLMEQAWKDACSASEMDYSDTELWEIEESKQAVWAEGRREIQFTTENGFCQYIGFIPVVGTFSIGNGYYVLTEDEAARLSALLEPTN